MVLEEGEYSYSYLYYPPITEELDKRYFKIEPGKINYIGDLYVNTYGDPYVGSNIVTDFIDNEDIILSRLLVEFPHIFEEYKYIKNITLVDNFYTVPKSVNWENKELY